MMSFVVVALVVALLFAVAWKLTGALPLGVLSLGWAGYAAYEYLMYARVLCTGDCNIRIDLLLIVPVLVGFSVWVAVKFSADALRLKKGVTK